LARTTTTTVQPWRRAIASLIFALLVLTPIFVALEAKAVLVPYGLPMKSFSAPAWPPTCSMDLPPGCTACPAD
tara:strand:- start:123 stop:341 length:219 start_codon:yes stop_codon:yes gene_type:complete